MNKMLSVSFGAVLAASAGAFAGEARPLYVASSNDKEGSSLFTNAAAWKVDGTGTVATEPPNAANDYLILASETRTPEPKKKGERYVFGGNSLHLGRLSSGRGGNLLVRNANYDTTIEFANEGVYLHQGYLGSWNAYNAAIYGTVHVDAPATLPFRIFTSGGNDGTMDFYGPFLGSGNLWIHSRLQAGNQNQTNFRCRFHNDALKDFTGTINTYWCEFSVLGGPSSLGYTQTFMSDTGTFPGHLHLHPGATYRGTTETSVFSVNKLTMDEDAVIAVQTSSDGSTGSVLRVTGSFAAADHLRVTTGMTVSDIKALAQQHGSYLPVCNLPFLTAPAGVEISEVPFNASGDYPQFPHFGAEKRVNESTGEQSLWMVPEGPVVTHNATGDDYGENSFTSYGKQANASRWSDGLSPTNPAVLYLDSSSKTLRTKLDSSGTYWDTFKGKAFVSTGGGGLSLACGGIVVDDWRIVGNYTLSNIGSKGAADKFDQCPAGQTPFGIRGRLRLSNGDFTFSIAPYDRKVFSVEAEISGGSTVSVYANKQDNHADTGGGVALLGDNANFFGRIRVSRGGNMDASAVTRLYFNDARNLGGACDTWTYDALRLQGGAVLCPLATVTLEAENRGIFFESGTPEVFVTNGVTLTVKERITQKVTFRKTGGGTLALGGERPYFVADGKTVPGVNTNGLVIAEGALKPVSSEAFRGLAVTMAAGTEIVVDVPTDRTKGVGKYGMLDTEWNVPFTLPEEGVTVRVTDPDGAAAPSESLARPLVVPVMTVKASCADAIRGKLCPVSPYADYQATVREIAEGDNITFAVKLNRGLFILVK